MKVIQCITCILLAFLMWGCQGSEQSNANPKEPVVGVLETKDKMITVRSGPEGPLYTIKTKDGEVLAVDLPTGDVSVKFPELKKLVEEGKAYQDASYYKSLEDL